MRKISPATCIALLGAAASRLARAEIVAEEVIDLATHLAPTGQLQWDAPPGMRRIGRGGLYTAGDVKAATSPSSFRHSLI